MNTFAALADPTRRAIVELLSRGEQTAGAITRKFGMSAPAISQHLKVLRQTNLVRVRADGQRRVYSLDPAGLTELDEWLERTRRFWGARLDDLARELNRAQPARKRRRKR